ncbi:alpha/beta hydrolase [Nocardioides houyundeii]|uniref:alpha/beta hydrolase n=1 Tax=Nocardioides houyundeii TaxID=2045452 RepID=UPI000C769FC1|nr:alpha/beta hydrolase [Nocardioides houyundeii]
MTVTINVPAAEPEMTAPKGEAGSADTLADTLYAVAGRYEEVGDTAETLRPMNGVWTGDAYQAYQDAAGRVSTEHSAMGTTVKRVAHAVTAYADNLRDLKRAYWDLKDRRTALDATRSTLISDIESAVDLTPAQVTALETRASDLAKSYRDLVTDHDAWARRVQDNEDLLRLTFEAATSLSDALSKDGGVNDTARDAMTKPGAPGTGATPEQTKSWWDSLSPAEQEAVISAYPGLVGSADGLPADVRDQANRVSLDGDLSRLGAKEDDGTLDPDERQMLENAKATRDALKTADGYVLPGTDPPERPGGQLWLYDPGAYEGDGRVAVGVGDLDTADDVSVHIPGIKTTMADVGDYTENAANLYESARYNGDGSTVATMFWLGYNTPEDAIDVDTVTRGRAEDGGRRLAEAIDGMRASRSGDPAHMTAIGHSYGSTTTSYAAVDHGLKVDDVVLIGSPGAGPSDDASDFSVGRDHVYVGRNSRDAVAFFGDEGWLHNPGGLGVDPSSRDFDATRFEAESVERGDHRNFDDHSRYFDPDSESLYNLGRIVDGHGDDVNEAEQSYDPWWRWAEDNEGEREPTSDIPGRSDTGQ